MKQMDDGSFTRQLATIICIDAVGFSRMMGLDDEATVSAFEDRRERIASVCEKFGGRMFGAAGDSVMVEFGSPIDALRAVFAFQDEIRKMNLGEPKERQMSFRAGINTGDVIVRGESLFGDDVNIAARLQELAPGGGAVISGTTYQHVKEKSFAVFNYLGEKSLKNIILPVPAYLCARPADEMSSDQPPSEGEALQSAIEPGEQRGPPAIAILPFRPLANDSELEIIADGIADDIAMGLANIRWLPVISRSSTFQFRDEKLNAYSAGKALGAGYVVSGTIARENSDIRLNVVLEDVAAARVLWTRRFGGEFANMLNLQGSVGSQIIAILEGQVDRAEQARAFQMPWEDLETWQLVRRGRWHMNRRTSKDTLLALECYEKARETDPNSSIVLGELAWWYFWRAWVRGGSEPDLEATERFSHQALYMDSQDARPHAYLGACEIMRKRPDEAIPHFQEALRINPSYAFANSGMGSSKLLNGQAADSIVHFRQAERLSPFDIYQFHNLGELASAYFHTGQWELAVATASRSLALSPGYFLSRLVKIGSLAKLGQHAEAEAELQIFRHRNPDFDLERVERIPYIDPQFSRRLLDAYLAVASEKS